MTRNKNVAVVGASAADGVLLDAAYETGRAIAREGWLLVCGGMGGVMEAAARGARDAGGQTLGLLPGPRHEDGNPHLSISIPTGLGHARNAVIAACADGVIAVGGEYGTLSEVALALKMNKPVAAIGRWGGVPGVHAADTPGAAVAFIKGRLA